MSDINKIPIFVSKKRRINNVFVYIMRKTFIIAVFVLLGLDLFSQTYQPSQEIRDAQQQFQDDKFGIFIHWGIYSMLGSGEWVMQNRNINYQEYPKLAGGFYPAHFNADEWVRAIKASGARYITITSRHHDGFSMFHTAQSAYNIVDATPFHRDIIKELAEACRREGIRLHFYYSHLDWGRTDYPLGRTGLGTGRPKDRQNWPEYYQFMNRQLTELLTNYGPIGAIWFDGVWDHDSDSKPFDWQLWGQYELIHRLQPSCLVANNHHLTPFPGEDIQIFERDLPGENKAGLSGQDISPLPLETCETMNTTWGYNILDDQYKSARQLIHLLVRAAGKNANLLLNIGPQPDGKLPEESLKRLSEIGEWMKLYEPTIRNTRGGDVAPHDWGVSTRHGDKLYIHILQLQDTSLFLPLSGLKVKGVCDFLTRRAVKYTKVEDGIVLHLEHAPDEIDHVIELTVK